MYTFNPDKDLPSLAGKVIFITGGTAGLGSASVLALAHHNPAHIYFSGRNATAAQDLIQRVQSAVPSTPVTFVECDLTSLDSVRAAAAKVTSPRLDILLCNAGIMAQPPGLSKDGYEVQFAVNHLGHAMLIQALLPLMLETAQLPDADVRIVLVTSIGFQGAPKGGIQFDKLATTQDEGLFWSWFRYGQSKLANVLYAAELARRYPAITSVSIHPGVVKTNLVGGLSMANRALVYGTNFWRMMTPEEGVLNQLWAAAGGKKDEVVNGMFYMPVGQVGEGKLTAQAKNKELAKELWEWTEKAIKGH